jgi:hypothetical protein
MLNILFLLAVLEEAMTAEQTLLVVAVRVVIEQQRD